MRRRWGLFQRRMRVERQLDSVDCGPTCLRMVATSYGRHYHRKRIVELCEQDTQGTSLGRLAKTAELLGFRARIARATVEALSQVDMPFIAYLPRGHFVVVERATASKIYTIDPGSGRIVFTKEEFASIWLNETNRDDGGVLLLLTPTDHLQPSDPKLSVGEPTIFKKSIVKLLRRTSIPLFAGALVMLAVQLALPFLSAFLVDSGVGRADVSLLWAILIAQVVLLLSRASVEVLQSWILAYVGLQIDLTMISSFLRKLSRIPFSFFSNRRIGDTIQRVDDHRAIQELLTEGVGQVFLAAISIAVFGAVLAIFSQRLFWIFLIGSAFYLLFCAWFLNSLRQQNYRLFSLMSARHSTLHQFLSNLTEIRLNNAAGYYRSGWESAQVAVSKVLIKTRLLSVIQFGGSNALNEIKNAILVVVAANDVVQGTMSLGAMVAVMFVVGQLNGPLMQLAVMVTKSSEAHLSYLRAREVYEIEDEDADLKGTALKLAGDIEFRGVSFRYRGLGAQNQVLKQLSVSIPHGKTTAIVGKSGCGKSTLLRLLLKMHSPDSGEMLIGGQPLSEIPATSWRNRCAVVLQDGAVFSDTIANNVAMSDQGDLARVQAACKVAQASDFIDALPLKYQTRIGLDGVGVSRGQLQRILIARALYRDPAFLFLDEATSALDAETESQVASALMSAWAGRTAIVIAHRLSTVRQAHKILVMDDGRIVEEGNHTELVALRGAYYNLVKHQLEKFEKAEHAIA